MNLFEQIREKSARMAAMLEAGVAVQRELTVLIDEINDKLGPIVLLFNAPQAAVLAAASRAGGPNVRRRGRKARAVSNDTAAPAVNGVPLVRKTKKGAAFGKADLVEILSGVTSASRDVIVRRMAARVGGALSTEQVKAKLAQMLSPCNSRGLFERLDNGEYRLATKPTILTNKNRAKDTAPRRGKGSRKKRAASGSNPRRRTARASGAFSGSRRSELAQMIVERLGAGPKGVGTLANEIAPMFPLSDKRDVADAMVGILDKDPRFQTNDEGDWRLA